MLLGAKLGNLEGKLGYREVVFKLSWAILFGPVVAFASRNAFPQQDQLAPFGVKVRPISAILGLC